MGENGTYAYANPMMKQSNDWSEHQSNRIKEEADSQSAS
jgi:hypothetical protein